MTATQLPPLQLTYYGSGGDSVAAIYTLWCPLES